MNAQARQFIRTAALLAAAILLASCVSPELYAPPLEGEPAAWIKLQYVYHSEVRGGPVTMHVHMFIRERQEEKFRHAHHKSLASLSKRANPKVPMHATRIRPAEDTAIRMRLGFGWGGLENWGPITYTDSGPSYQYPPLYENYEVGCSATQQFSPEPDKVYLVSYTALHVPKHCAVAIFLETPTGEGTFKLEPVGEPYVE